jgi:hypothetical protein
MNTAERDNFESWAKANGFGKSLAASWAWDAWQARANLAPKQDADGWRWRFKEGRDRTWRYAEKMPGFDSNIVEAQPLVLMIPNHTAQG